MTQDEKEKLMADVYNDVFADAVIHGTGLLKVSMNGLEHVPHNKFVLQREFNVEYERMQFSAWFGEQLGYDAFPETVVSGVAWRAWQARAKL